MTALYKHPVTLTHAHIVAVVGVGHTAFHTDFFFFHLYFLGGLNCWQKFSTGCHQKPQNKIWRFLHLQQSSLYISKTIFSGRDRSELLIGDDNPLLLTITAVNRGEGAYEAELHTLVPPEADYVGVKRSGEV